VKGCLLGLVAFLLLSPVAHADTVALPLVAKYAGRDWVTVAHVTDGDTFKTTAGERVRLLAVDTPEVFFGTQCFGPEASARATELLTGQVVGLERDTSDTDRYGRLLRHVYLVDGLWVNGTLVAEGFARVTIYPPDRRHEDLLRTLEAQAKATGAGGWSACGWSLDP